MCKAFGNPSFVTVGSDEKVARCVELGADGGVNRHEGGFVDAVSEWTAGQGADVILDPVGGAYLADNLASLNLDGRLVVIGLLGGSRAELPLGMMMTRRLRVIGSTLRARTIAAKALVLDALKDRVWPLIEEGMIRAVVERELPIEKAKAAHELIASNDTFGKVAMNIVGQRTYG